MEQQPQSKAGLFAKIRPLHILDAVIVLAVVVIGVALLTQHKSDASTTCDKPGATHRLQLQNDAFSEPTVTAKRCDVLVIENHDTQAYSLNFGVHDNHIAYPGYTAAALQQNETVSINLLKAGNFEFHDHLRDNAKIELTIQ
jgi:hypothetical protein